VKRHLTAVMLALFSLMAGCASPGDSEAAASGSSTAGSNSTTRPQDSWLEVAGILGKTGALKDGVYTIVFPRDDLNVTIEGMDVPKAAGLESTFWFYRCTCGKTSVVGQFVVADYEANDVIDALRAKQMKIASLTPLLIYEKPRLMLIRFQAEGEPGPMAKTLKEALRWTGKERMAPQKVE
jgi:hypothetical protein